MPEMLPAPAEMPRVAASLALLMNRVPAWVYQTKP